MIEQVRGAVRLGAVLFPDRVVVALARGGRAIDTFSIVDAEHPAEALRAELESRGLKPRSARLAAQRLFVTVKALELPAAGADDLSQMVQFELERHVPFPSDDAAYDWIPLGNNSNGRRVLVVASERRLVDRVVHLLSEAKIRPASLTVAAHDLLPLLARRPRAEHAVWMHRVGDTADLLFITGNALALSRSVPAADVAASGAEIRGTLAMLRWSHCDALWVSGDGADAFQRSLALEALGLSAEPPPLSAWGRRAIDTTDAAPDGAAVLARAVAVGPRRPVLDLLPVGLRPRRLTRQQAITGGMIALTALLGVAALLAPGIRNQRQLAYLNGEIRRLDPEVRAVERVLDALDRQRRLLSNVDRINATSVRPLPVLRELTDLLPSDVWLTALALDQKATELTGQAAAASALIPLLENSPRFERVEFASPVTRGRDKEQFRIRAAWEAPPASQVVAPTPPSASAPVPPPRSPAPAPPAAPPLTGTPGSAARPRPQPPAPSGGRFPPGAVPPVVPRTAPTPAPVLPRTVPAPPPVLPRTAPLPRPAIPPSPPIEEPEIDPEFPGDEQEIEESGVQEDEEQQ
jgi:Tfp pilus assembly protein PilN